ncbi:MAG: VacB/RNase II family 3'-5' exoribonuclease [Myxococcales bacterium]|nr:VacB/RNase II family 3'-5' exoribonuclease [Myxococcales bacterium]
MAQKQDHAQLRTLLLDMVSDGALDVISGGAFALPPQGRPGDKHAASPNKHAQPAHSQPSATPTAASGKLPWQGRGGAGGTPPHGVASAATTAAAPPSTPTQAPTSAPERGMAKGLRGDRDRTAEAPHGIIVVNPGGFGFVRVSDGKDVYVSQVRRGESIDGDDVELRFWRGDRGFEGEVVRVLARTKHRVAGLLKRDGTRVWIEPDDPRVAIDLPRIFLKKNPGGEGTCIVDIGKATTRSRRAELAVDASVIALLGTSDDPITETEKIVALGGFPVEFPEDAKAQAAATPTTVIEADHRDRTDLRHLRFCTIDPETARDFDDARCIEQMAKGATRVWVAVADVAHYVRWNDPIDTSAKERGVSVYLPDRVISMIPIQLSAGICSLNPHLDRCAMVVKLEFDAKGKITSSEPMAALIQSKARFDYGGVSCVLEPSAGPVREGYEPWRPELEALFALSRKLREIRMERGSLDLELPEPKVVLDADNPKLVRDVVRAKASPAVKLAYSLVEEFMLCANEAVGRYFNQRKLTSVWRIHAPPGEEKLGEFADLLGTYGIKVDIENAQTPKGMKAVLDQVSTMPAARALTQLLLRSLTQAQWDIVPIGHFGLASAEYVHFTSPIRRYPDLLAHRLLKHALHAEGKPSGGGYEGKTPPNDVVQELAHASSRHERRAMDAERDTVAMYRAFLVRDRLGEQFEGVVSAVTSFGAFIEIETPFVEGLVRSEKLGDGTGFDPIRLRLKSRFSGKELRLGDRVKIQISDVSVAKRRIEFDLLEVLTVHPPADDDAASDAARVERGRKGGAADGARARRPTLKKEMETHRKLKSLWDASPGRSAAGPSAKDKGKRAVPGKGKPSRAAAQPGAKLSLKVSHRGRMAGAKKKR